MSHWIDVAPINEFLSGTCRTIEIDNKSIAVFNLNNQFYAIENVCTHDGGTLTGGCVINDEVVCPRHGARFSIKTGAVTAPPAYEDVATFPVRVEYGVVQVLLNMVDKR